LASTEPSVAARKPRLWLFNLDAEIELARTGPYQTRAVVARALARMEVHAHGLLSPGDQLLVPGARPAAGSFIGSAWCPTPSARKRLEEAGAPHEPAPAVEVLRRVNHRTFVLSLGGGAPGARYVAGAPDLEDVLGRARERPWLFKRPLSFAGRGLRRIGASPSADDRRWLQDALAGGGLLAEPFLEIERELSLHGWIDENGRLSLGHVCRQHTNTYRAWVGTTRTKPDELAATHTRALAARGEQVGEALWRAEYWGPFGIDAYVWRAPNGTSELNSLGELNARYTMGFSTGFGAPPPRPS
jgi:hypothetical protein